VLATVVAGLLCPSSARAVDYTWRAGTGTWSNGASWVSGAVPPNPVTGDTVNFNAPGSNANEIVYLNGDRSINNGVMSISNTGSTTFLSGTAATISGTNALTLQNLFVNAGAGPVTFGAPGSVVLNIVQGAGSIYGYYNNSGSTLTFYSSINAASTSRPIVYGGSGAIDQVGALIGGRDFAKFGTGTVSLRAASTLTTSANQAVVAGGVRLVDAGTLPSVTTAGFGLRSGGSLILDNRGTTNLADRLAANALIQSTFGGGSFVFLGANNSLSTEATGTLSPASGVLRVASSPGTSGTSTVTFAALTRTSGAMLEFAGEGLGSGSNSIMFATAPTLSNNVLGGWATVGNEFATYNQDGAGNTNANGVQAMANGAYSATFGAGQNVKLTSGGSLGSAANTLNLQTTSAQAFTIATTSTLGAVLNYAASGVNTISGGTLTNGTSELVFITASDLSVGSRVIGNGALTKSGTGTLTLGGTGATRTSAGVFVNAGTLKITDATAVYNTGSAVSGVITVGRRSTFEVGTATTWATAGNMPTLKLNDVDAAMKVSGSSTFTLDRPIGLATVFQNGNANPSLNAESTRFFLNAESVSDTLNLSQALQVLNANSGAATIAISGSGTVILSGSASNAVASNVANNGFYSWDVTGGGTLLVTSTGSNPLGITGRTVTATRGTVALGSDTTTNYAYVLNGGTLAGAGGGTRTVNASSTVTLGAPSTIDLKDAAEGATANMGLAFGGTISGTGSLTIAATGTGAGVLTLSGSNTYTGATTLAGGVLALGGSNALSGGGTLAFAGGSLRYGAGNTTLDYSSRIKASGSAVAIDTNGQSVVFASIVDSSNVGGLVKSGDGTLTLAAANTYLGDTVISGGTLTLGTGGSFANSSRIVVGDSGSSGAVLDLTQRGSLTISASQTLKGTGTVVLGGSTSLTVAGLFSPGNSPGLFTYDGGSTTLSGTTLMEIWGTSRGAVDGYDAVNVTNGGLLTFGGPLVLDFNQSFGSATSFVLFDTIAGGTLNGLFSGITITGSNSDYTTLSFTWTGDAWSTGASGNGQSLQLTQSDSQVILQVVAAVPEPGTVALAGIGGVIAAWSLRRRRRDVTPRPS
jgi:autotransporter-associated beta strand protein